MLIVAPKVLILQKAREKRIKSDFRVFLETMSFFTFKYILLVIALVLSPEIWRMKFGLTINSYLKHYFYVTLYLSYSFFLLQIFKRQKGDKFKWPKTLKIYCVNFFQGLVFVITKFMHLSIFFCFFLSVPEEEYERRGRARRECP